jgi:hypothetical protein
MPSVSLESALLLQKEVIGAKAAALCSVEWLGVLWCVVGKPSHPSARRPLACRGRGAQSRCWRSAGRVKAKRSSSCPAGPRVAAAACVS